MATGGNEALFDNGKKFMFLFLCQWLSFFLQHMYYLYL